MTARPTAGGPQTYRIDGRRVKTVKDFYREVGRAVNGPGGYFGKNLDALADCLRGGFGTPENRPFEFEWAHSEQSRRLLQDIAHGHGTFFDAVRDVFDDAGVTLNLT
jgi:RNAse (barnase) inhibitor barstar